MASQYVGIDLHRRHSVIVRQDAAGEVLAQVHIDNDPVALACEVEKAGADPEVVLEATYGWYWAADVLTACGAKVHLAHPLGVKGWSYRRVKNDQLDAGGLADLLRMAGCLSRGSPRRRSASCATWSVTARSWWPCARASRRRCMQCWPRKASRRQ